MMYVFDCAECGDTVVSYLYQFDAEANQQLCTMCTWLNTIKDPVEREAVRAYVNRQRKEDGTL